MDALPTCEDAAQDAANVFSICLTFDTSIRSLKTEQVNLFNGGKSGKLRGGIRYKMDQGNCGRKRMHQQLKEVEIKRKHRSEDTAIKIE